MSDPLQHVRGIRDEVARRLREPIFAEGFDTAADICRAAFEEQLRPLRERLSRGELDTAEQRLFGTLEALRNRFEQELAERQSSH